ncbi:MAG: serine/threonine protein kinase [Myxococcota bacterium]|nr:serine/threonine protein kinase [Myxococcota bacterium]
MTASEPDAAIPVRTERLGAFELLIEIASGGMATVYLARAVDQRTGPPLVALKRPHRHLTSDKTFLTMLVDEARLASAIDHPNVVRVRELGFDGGVPFIVMDYIEGASLAELRRELSAVHRALDVRVALRIALDALAGLHAAHELKDGAGRSLHIVHRDVSPHNVLIGSDGRSHLTDFGIAQADDRIQTTRTHEVKGKLAYLAPERIDKRRVCTVQSDVFSMAVVLWECFAGRRLFRGDEPVDILQDVMNAPIPTLREIGATIPAALDDVIARGLSRDLETRYASASDFAHALERSVGPDHVGTHADTARLIEVVFGARMAMRQEQVRTAVGVGDFAELLEASGLPTRERHWLADAPVGEPFAGLAPPAPTGRYVHGYVTGHLPKLRSRLRGRIPWWSMAAVAAGMVGGTLVTLVVVAHRTRPEPLPVAPEATAGVNDVVLVAPGRRVVLPLPFLASRVVFDDEARDLAPAVDVVAFEVPPGTGARHRVMAVAIDGTRAQGFVRDEDGIARPEADGYALIAPDPNAVREAGTRPTRPIGNLRDGFTKLR